MKPRDAATLIIIRNRREVLLGLRNARHVFMPHRYVFPGGSVDAGDARVPCPIDLPARVERRLTRSVSAARARALAMAAVRETFEETGLRLGKNVSTTLVTRSSHWQPFFAHGIAPALDKLDYFARAITPPGMVRRFDARFFTVDARHLSGSVNGNGELTDLRWVPLDRPHKLTLAPITRLVLNALTIALQLPCEDNSDELQAVARSELIELHELML
tara:strand:+ start:143713 stop:144363 length:651 start_codon:yes stop_codon:yes gene_type:complete